MGEPFIKVENLSYLYEDEGDQKSPVLKNFSLDIYEGEFVAILGHNGSGKSTLAKLLNMILTPTEGRITVAGVDLTSEELTDEDIINLRKNIGMVFQNPDNQLVATIVEEDVAFGPENLGVPSEEIRQRVDAALGDVGMLRYAKHEPHRLSGGQKQRVAIAGVLAMGPECIVLDEPTAMLDPKGRAQVMETVVSLAKNEGKTVILITHFMEEAALCDRVVVLNDGEVLLDAPPKEVFSQRDKLKSVGLSTPAVTELCALLKDGGLDVCDGIIDEKECLEEIKKALKG